MRLFRAARKSGALLGIIVVVTANAGASAYAQRQGAGQGSQKPQTIKPPELPNDPKLRELHREFIIKAERLANEYERKKNFGGAQAVYESLLRVAPDHKLADQALKMAKEAQAQDRKIVRVMADHDWQPTGVEIVPGSPVHLLAKGAWTVATEVGPNGVQIPDSMQIKDNRLKLGALIGVVAPPGKPELGRPFRIGESHSFTAERGGMLHLKMYSIDPSRNEGTIDVAIRSTFK